MLSVVPKLPIINWGNQDWFTPNNLEEQLRDANRSPINSPTLFFSSGSAPVIHISVWGPWNVYVYGTSDVELSPITHNRTIYDHTAPSPIRAGVTKGICHYLSPHEGKHYLFIPHILGKCPFVVENIPGHTTLLRGWINVIDVDSTSQQRSVPRWTYQFLAFCSNVPICVCNHGNTVQICMCNNVLITTQHAVSTASFNVL